MVADEIAAFVSAVQKGVMVFACLIVAAIFDLSQVGEGRFIFSASLIGLEIFHLSALDWVKPSGKTFWLFAWRPKNSETLAIAGPANRTLKAAVVFGAYFLAGHLSSCGLAPEAVLTAFYGSAVMYHLIFY